MANPEQRGPSPCSKCGKVHSGNCSESNGEEGESEPSNVELTSMSITDLKEELEKIRTKINKMTSASQYRGRPASDPEVARNQEKRVKKQREKGKEIRNNLKKKAEKLESVIEEKQERVEEIEDKVEDRIDERFEKFKEEFDWGGYSGLDNELKKRNSEEEIDDVIDSYSQNLDEDEKQTIEEFVSEEIIPLKREISSLKGE